MLQIMRTIGNFVLWLIQGIVNTIWSYDVLRWSFSIFIISLVLGLIVKFALGLRGGNEK